MEPQSVQDKEKVPEACQRKGRLWIKDPCSEWLWSLCNCTGVGRKARGLSSLMLGPQRIEQIFPEKHGLQVVFPKHTFSGRERVNGKSGRLGVQETGVSNGSPSLGLDTETQEGVLGPSGPG